MELTVKRFDELTLDELYDIMALRVSVFVVEQHCPYLDPDGADRHALHVFFRDETGIQAYLRVLEAGVNFPQVSIGRVISVRRRMGIGSRLLEAGITAARERLCAGQIYIEAQTYAIPFYEAKGFRQVSEEFLEDGIPHVGMLLDLERESK